MKITIWIADAHRDGERFVVRADEKLNCVPGARFIALNRAKLPNHQGGTRAAPNEHDLWYPPDCRSRIELRLRGSATSFPRSQASPLGLSKAATAK
jgi:hypothetical protein